MEIEREAVSAHNEESQPVDQYVQHISHSRYSEGVKARDPLFYSPSKFRQIQQDQTSNPDPVQQQPIPPSSPASNSKPFNSNRIITTPLIIHFPNEGRYKTYINTKSSKKCKDLLRALCNKLGYSPMEDYELVAIKSEDYETVIPLDELVHVVSERVTKSECRLEVRKCTKAPEASASTGTLAFKRILNPSKTPAGGSSIEISAVSLEASSSLSTSINQSAPSLVEAVSDLSISMTHAQSESALDSERTGRKRRLSIPSIASFIFGGLSRSRKNTSNIKLETDDYPIFKTHMDERKVMVNKLIPDMLIGLFDNNVENHGLNFGKLTSRKRFLSWTRSSNNSSPKTSDSKILKSTAVFGVRLEDLMQRELDNDGKQKIPQFFLDCSIFLEETSLNVPGIFRVSGVQSRVKALKQQVDQGKEIDFTNIRPHDVTSLMKMFLREMPEPLLTFRLYEFYIGAAKHLNDSALDDAIRLLTLTLPISHLTVLRQLLHVLRKIAEHSETSVTDVAKDEGDLLSISTDDDCGGNLMSIHNLAIVMAPNILRTQETINPLHLVAHAGYGHKIVEHMIRMGDHLFNAPKELINTARIANS